MVGNLHHAVVIQWKSIITGRRNVRAEDWETLRREELMLAWFQVEHRLAGGTEELLHKRQLIRRPSAGRHYYKIARDSFSVIKNNSHDAIVAFVQTRKPDTFAQLHAQRFGATD